MTVMLHQRTIVHMVLPEEDQQAWLMGLLKRYDLTATELARRAELNPSTLTRFLQPGGREGHELSARTIRKIKDSLHLADQSTNSVSGASIQPEARLITNTDQLPAEIQVAARALTTGRNGVDLWHIQSAGLDPIRLARGDIAIVDLNAEPRSRDRVCAQIYDHPSGTASTVFRLWEPPYLLSGGIGRPEVPDGRNVVIIGVVIATLTPRSLFYMAPAA